MLFIEVLNFFGNTISSQDHIIYELTCSLLNLLLIKRWPKYTFIGWCQEYTLQGHNCGRGVLYSVLSNDYWLLTMTPMGLPLFLSLEFGMLMTFSALKHGFHVRMKPMKWPQGVHWFCGMICRDARCTLDVIQYWFSEDGIPPLVCSCRRCVHLFFNLSFSWLLCLTQYCQGSCTSVVLTFASFSSIENYCILD